MHGVTTVISLSTGELLDYAVDNKHSHACSRRRAAVSAGQMTPAVFANWRTGHVENCSVATWAAILHKTLHDDPANQHRFCPLGEDSWCGWL